MPLLVEKQNVITAQHMYRERIRFLRSEVSRLVDRCIELGEDYESETMSALDEIEEELDGINECLVLLKHLRRSRAWI